MIIDNFLDHWDAFRAYCDDLDYADTTNPYDDVVYPGISTAIPSGVSAEAIYKAQNIIGKPVLEATQFLRLTLEGVEVPHSAHEDSSMADWLLLIYMNRSEHCKGGTELVQHKETFMDHRPASQQELKLWERDTNDYDAWEPVFSYDMVSNRAVLIEAQKMHRAMMPYGFGNDATNGRLVFSSFIRLMP